MENLKVLSQTEIIKINGGGAKPGPSTMGVTIAHFVADFVRGAIDRFNAFR